MSSEGVFSRAMSGVNQARKVASDYAGPAVETTVELTKRATQVVKEAIPPAIKLAEEAAATGATLAGQAASAASQGAASARDTFLAYHTAHVQPMLSSGMAYSVAVMGTSGVYLKQAMFYSIGYMEQVSVQAWDFTGQFLAKSYKSFLLLTNEMQEIAFDEFLRRNQVCSQETLAKMTGPAHLCAAIFSAAPRPRSLISSPLIPSPPISRSQITILTSAGALTFAALLLRGLKPSTARVLDGPKDTVSVQEAQEKSMEAFAAFKRAGIRGGDCIVAAVGAVQAVELAVWCRAYNAPLYVTNPWADAALIKKLLQEHSPRVRISPATCSRCRAGVHPSSLQNCSSRPRGPPPR